eukprot:TRINITY_DN9625_c0_g1_i10.p2 TRINITY_DN9625_c0_g1~~TRINITY_DN9625_c0_g1_i10.p2  ORF type:complete len:172 (+),score=31.24 TRINITY_DN9625_c0_g1_i10:876-1391(+)
MSSEYRFFFIGLGSFIFVFLFLIGITFVPLICGIRYLVAKARSPGDPPELNDPYKPVKPSEPRIGATSEDWIAYRKLLAEYRSAKAKWKEESLKRRESRVMREYDEDRLKKEREMRKYRAEVLIPARKGLCSSFEVMTSQVLFMREETPKLVRCLLKSHYTIGADYMNYYT